jgi:catechol 2,3-dioxygenase-like lactoylglutathione lyase family enzyme
MNEPILDVPVLKPLALSHIGITVADLDRSLQYYRKVLGFQLIYDNQAEEGADRVLIGLIAGAAVELIKKSGDAGLGRIKEIDAIGFSCITFSVPDVDEAYAALEAAGLANMDPPVTLPVGFRLVFLRDPDGNLLELIDLNGSKSLAEMATEQA